MRNPSFSLTDPQTKHFYFLILSQVILSAAKLTDLSQDNLQLLTAFQATLFISSIMFIKGSWAISMIIFLGYAQVCHFYFAVFPDAIFMALKFLLLGITLSLLKNGQDISLDLELLPKEFQEYETCPQRYLVSAMKKCKKWQETPKETLTIFLKDIGNLYNDLPYHNLTHAFDVTVNLDRYLIDFGMMKKLELTDEERIYMLIAAYAHDSGHEGFSNTFYMERHAELAIRYSYRSPLESMHCSNLMKVLRNFPDLVPQGSKKMMVRMIMATDTFAHQNTVMKMKEMEGQICKENYEFIAEVLLHTADINNPSKQLNLFLVWNKRLYKEFDKQNRLLKKRISIKTIPKRRQSQTDRNEVLFLKGVVVPLYKQLSVFSPGFSEMVLQTEKNINYWQKLARDD